jgi:putative membrane-bound dehydrogenase-like protein
LLKLQGRLFDSPSDFQSKTFGWCRAIGQFIFGFVKPTFEKIALLIEPPIGIRIFAALAFLLFGAVMSGAENPAPAVMVGVAQIDITPDYPIRLSGFGFRRTESEGVTAHIWAKALAFPDPKEGPAILIATDNLCVPDTITQEIGRRLAAKAGVKLERLTITSTHTHTAPMLTGVCPTLFGVPIPPEHLAHIDRYTKEFTDKLEEVALAALRDAKPSHLSWGMGTAGFSTNRRTKGGPIDHDLPVLVVRDLNDKVRAIYFSYACHCVTLSNNKISGDWSGFAKEAVQALYPGAIALASVGCGADSNPSPRGDGNTASVAVDQGEQIANELKRLLAGKLPAITGLTAIHYARVDLPLDTPRTRSDWEERAKRTDAVGYHAKVNLERLDQGQILPSKINYPVQTWVFGNALAMVFLPGETVVDYSLRLKEQFDHSRLWVNGYANDARCYIPSERVLKEGGYEGGDAMVYYDFPQRFAPGLEQKLIDTVTKQVPASFVAPKGTEGSRPLSASESLGALRVKPGLTAELVASEPLIQDPVAIDWGADGKLWVCEMNDYPTGLDENWQPGGRVKFLEDTDGHYDKATVFLGNLPFPTGLMAWGRGIYICAAPDILYAEDTDGDGKADKIEKVFTGFPTENYQARVNSLSLGLDNWIYGANGLLGGVIRPGAKLEGGREINIRNHDFRFRPNSSVFETVSGLTQQGRVRDDWGNWFGCNNSQLLLNYPVPEQYSQRNPHVSMSESTQYVPADPNSSQLYPASRLMARFNDPGSANHVTSGCGLGLYRDTLLGKEYYENAFTCEPVHNLVHREVMSADGITFRSYRGADEQNSEFLASTDNWFRPVQVRTGPDGALYVVDMYRFVIEHPRWIPAERLAKIDVRAGADKGRIYRIRNSKETLRPIQDLTKFSGAALAAALDTPNGVERDRIQVELIVRHDAGTTDTLRAMAQKAPLPQVRVQALSALEAAGGVDASLLREALSDADPNVRRQAIQFCEPFLKKTSAAALLEPLLKLSSDSSPAVLCQLAFTLGNSSDPRAGQTLGELARAHIKDSQLRMAILSSAAAHTSEILNAVMSLGEESTERSEWLAPLVATAVGTKEKDAVTRALDAVLPPGNKSAATYHYIALANLIDALDRNQLKLSDYISSETKSRLEGVINSAREVAGNSSAPEESRKVALRLVARNGLDAQALSLLSELATSSPSEALRSSAINALRRQRSTEVPRALLNNWPQTSPANRNSIISLLLDRNEWTRPLLEAIKDGRVQAREISLSDRQRLAQSHDAGLRKLAAETLAEPEKTGRQEALTRYQAALSLSGHAQNGSDLFTKNCSSCHLLRGIGHDVGPDLAALANKDGAYFLKNILDPNAAIEPRFVNYQVELKDDRSLSGLIKGESATSLTVASANGLSETVLRKDIANIRASSLSLMPEGLEQTMDFQQMADLLAFLRGTAAPKVIAGNHPELISAAADGAVMLSAAKAEIYGSEITFEPDFQNLGMWHGQDDYAAWNMRVEKAETLDIYLDYACADAASGNSVAVTIGSQSLKAPVAVTGNDWSDYKHAKIGTVKLDAGQQRVTLSALGPIHTALLDLRSLALVPSGSKPVWAKSAAAASDDVLRDPVAVAQFALDPKHPTAAREAAINANPQFAGPIVAEMTRGIAPRSNEEYERIPWIWRVALVCGKGNDARQIKNLLGIALPKVGESLRDWQIVVMGGGIVNGLSQRGIWPGDRLREIMQGDDSLKKRWLSSVEAASKIAENQAIPTGTRYDALRMLGTETWEKRGAQLAASLSKTTDPELQMGAVSALNDIHSGEVASALLRAIPDLTEQNQKLALDALLRDEPRIRALLDAVEAKRFDGGTLGNERIKVLSELSDPALGNRARSLLQDSTHKHD